MKTLKKRVVTLLLSLVFIFQTAFSVFAYDNIKLQNAINDTSKCVQNTVKNPSVASIGGEWAVIGVAKSVNGISKDYKDKYLKNLKGVLTKSKGVLSNVKYTEYSRAILAVSALGLDASNIYSYNLLRPIADYNNTTRQGINGAIWALIALDSRNYQIPQNKNAKVLATRQKYIDYILSLQHTDGGFALIPDKKTKSDPDITAMVLQAFSKYQGNEKVSRATVSALNFLSNTQNKNSGFYSNNSENSESSSQVIIALSMLNIPLNDKRFVKNNKTVIDSLMNFYVKGKGFKHSLKENTVNQMSTEQALIALSALERFQNKKQGIYNMNIIKP